jgi:DNA-directed RNA polymerase specialized sigma24 family protein
VTALDEDRDYTEYAASALPWLRRFAYLLCQDWHRADDLVQTAATQLYVHWKKASRVEHLDAYTRKSLVNVYTALFHQLTLLGPDQADWTTQVLG